MNQFVRSIKRQLRQAEGGERFVRLIVGGGIALVVGLWLGTLSPMWSLPWLVASAFVLVGTAGLAVGIWTQIDR